MANGSQKVTTYSSNALIPKRDSISLSNFTDTSNFIYTYYGGSNSIGDKPTNVDAFGVMSFKTADGWYGQLLMSSDTATGVYWRTDTTLSGGWKKILDSSNYTDYTVTKTGNGASGTWGISITGSATTATNLAAAPTITNASNDIVTSLAASTTYTLNIGGQTLSFTTAPNTTPYGIRVYKDTPSSSSFNDNYPILVGRTAVENMSYNSSNYVNNIYATAHSDKSKLLMYNPYTQTLTIGGGTLTGEEYSGNAATASSVAWANVSNKPETATRWPKWSEITEKATTLSGYGITDAKIASGVITLGSNTITPITSIADLTGSTITAANLRTNLGLTAALRFIGKATTDINESTTTAPTVTGITNYVPEVGDVVLDKNNDAEYVCIAKTTVNNTTTYTWELLGRSGSWATSTHTHGNITNGGLLGAANMAVVTDGSKKITTADLSVTDANASTNATTTFVQAVTQNAQGKITVTKASLSTSGTWSGNANTATTATNLANNPSIQASTSNANQVTITAGGKTSSAYTVPYATYSAQADYLHPYNDGTNVPGKTNIQILQTIQNNDDTPRSVPFGVRLLHGNTDVGFGYFYPKNLLYGGWYIASYGGPSYVAVTNGTWETYWFLTSKNTAAGTNNAATLTWNTTYTIAKINGTDIKFTTMAKPSAADIGAATSGHNHDGTYSYIHLTDYSFTTTKPLSKYVTFDKNSPDGAPTSDWYNGFISSHGNYLASYIINQHRTANWYVGYGQFDTSTNTAPVPTWYLLAHSGNVGTGDANGQIKIAGVNVSVKGLAALAYKASLSYSDVGAAPAVTGGYLPLSGGQMVGPLTWKNNTALPETTSSQYFLVIDSFANGGTTKWINKANALTSLGAAPSSHKHDASDINSGTFDVARIPNLSWNKITSDKPTTLSGYGITDAASSNHSHTLKIGNKSLSVSTSEQEWTVHDILYNSSHNIGANTSWDITEPGVYYVASSGAFTGEQNPSSNGDQSAPYTYGHAFTIRAGNGGASQFYISDYASASKASSHGIRYRSGWNVNNTSKTAAERWQEWATILDDKNFNLYAPTLTGTGASGSWRISITGTAAKATADASGNTITSTYAPLASPALTGTPTAPTAANGTNTTQIATTAFVNNTLSYINAMTFKGTLGTEGTITALPASHEAGDTYRVITAGTWAGKYCEVGTLIICVKDGTTASDNDWTSVETNEDGAVIGPASSTDNAIARFDGATGRIIQDSKVTIDDNGCITLTHVNGKNKELSIQYGSTIDYWWGVGTANTNHGMFDVKAGKWIISAGADNKWYFDGNADSATSANYIKLYEARGTTTTLNKAANYVAAGAMFHLVASSSTSATDNGKTPTDANILQMNWDNSGGYDAQLGIATGANRMYFRSRPSQKVAWDEVAHAPVGTTGVGNATQPVYMTTEGVITAGTALKALAYKDSLVSDDIPNNSANTTGNAATATAIQTAGTTAQFYRGDNTWSNIIKQTTNAALGIDTNLKIGTARKDLNFDIENGNGTGINDGYASGITWGNGTSAYAGIYYQSSGSYGTRLILATTNLYADGAKARMIIQNNGYIGIGTLSPDTLLTVNGNAKATKFIGALQGNADTATNISSTTPTLAAGTENNAIKVIDLGNSTPAVGAAQRHAIDFRWYDSHWAIGNIRTNSYPSAGFGFSYSEDAGSTYTNVCIISTSGTVTATQFSGPLTGDVTGNVNGNAATASKISAALANNKKTYLLGTQTAITATAANVSLTGDTGVYLTATAGELSAARYSWNVSGAEKAYTVYNATDDSIDFVFI